MRPVAAILLAVLILGSVKAYTLFESSLPAPVATFQEPIRATGEFSVEVTLTFDAAPDDFALEPSSILIELHGRELYRSEEKVAGGAAIVLDDVPGVVEGSNSFFVKIAPAEFDFKTQRAVRVRVLRDDLAMAEETLWSEPGAAVEGLVNVHVRHVHSTEPHEH